MRNKKSQSIVLTLLCLLSIPLYAIPSGLVGLWQGEGNANDSAQNNHGTLVGDTTFASGKVGQAFLMDGSGDFIDTPITNPLGGTFTVSAWVNVASVANHNSIFGKGISDSNEELIFAVLAGGGFYFDTLDQFRQNGSSLITANEWFHLTASKNGTTLRGWVNGIEISMSGGSQGSSNTSQSLQIGASRSSTLTFNGMLDEVALFDRALSDSEVLDVMVNGFGSPIPEPNTLFLFTLSLTIICLRKKRGTEISFQL